MSGHLARLSKQAGQDAPKSLPTLEVNAAHASGRAARSDERFDDLAQITSTRRCWPRSASSRISGLRAGR